MIKKLLCKLFGHKWGDLQMRSQDGGCTLWVTTCPRCKKEKFIGAIDCAWLPEQGRLEAKIV